MHEGHDVEMTQRDNGHWHFTLGPVERKVISLALLVFVSLVSWVFYGFADRMKTQGSTMDHIVIQQAVTNQQLQMLSTQLADVPGLTRQIAELQVQATRNAQDIRDLQQVKGLRR